jgi:hypothetical protein
MPDRPGAPVPNDRHDAFGGPSLLFGGGRLGAGSGHRCDHPTGFAVLHRVGATLENRLKPTIF